MIDMYEAIRLARLHFDRAYQGDSLKDVRLEGIEPSSDGTLWLVTFGFREESSQVVRRGGNLPDNLWGVDRPQFAAFPRVYKTVYLDRATGDSTQIRPFNNNAA